MVFDSFSEYSIFAGLMPIPTKLSRMGRRPTTNAACGSLALSDDVAPSTVTLPVVFISVTATPAVA